MGTQDKNQHEATDDKRQVPEIWPGQHPVFVSVSHRDLPFTTCSNVVLPPLSQRKEGILVMSCSHMHIVNCGAKGWNHSCMDTSNSFWRKCKLNKKM